MPSTPPAAPTAMPPLPAPSAAAREVLAACVAYGKRPHPGLAAMLHGPWGCGKTWFMKNRLMPALKEAGRRCLYISVNGITDDSGLDAEIVRAIAESRLPGEKSRTLVQVVMEKAKDSLAIVSDATDGTVGVALKTLSHLAGTRVAAKTLIDLALGDDMVLIFDDLERHGMRDEQELLGYINQYSEHRRMHVFLGCDLDRMPKLFRTQRLEKVCGLRLQIRPELDAFLHVTIVKDPVGLTTDFLTSFNDELKKIIGNLERPNLRRLSLAIYHFKTVDDEVLKVCSSLGIEQKKAQEIREYLFRHLLYGVMESNDGRLCAVVFADLLSAIAKAVGQADTPKEDRDHTTDRYLPGGSSELLPEELKVLAAVVDRGTLDQAGIRRLVMRITYTPETRFEEVYRRLTTGEFLGLEDSNLDSEIAEVLGHMESGALTSPEQFAKLATSVLDLSAGGYTTHAPRRIHSRIKAALASTDLTLFDSENRLRRPTVIRGSSSSSTSEVVKLVNTRIDTLLRHHLNLTTQELWGHGVMAFLEGVCSQVDGPHYTSPLLAAISPRTFWDAVWALTNAEREIVYSHLSLRLHHLNAHYQFDKLEDEWIKKSHKLLAKHSAALSRGISAQMNKRLFTLLGEPRKVRPSARKNPATNS